MCDSSSFEWIFFRFSPIHYCFLLNRKGFLCKLCKNILFYLYVYKHFECGSIKNKIFYSKSLSRKVFSRLFPLRNILWKGMKLLYAIKVHCWSWNGAPVLIQFGECNCELARIILRHFIILYRTLYYITSYCIWYILYRSTWGL